GTEKVRFLYRLIYNRQQYAMFDSDLGLFVGDTPYGEKVAQHINSKAEYMDYCRSAVNRHCRYNYGVFTPFLVKRRVHPSPSQS
ncbi:HB2L protein, partial [Thryothorus ludovicianus]|nr:HB2L protein [Thryothorus ludovicianus]